MGKGKRKRERNRIIRNYTYDSDSFVWNLIRWFENGYFGIFWNKRDNSIPMLTVYYKSLCLTFARNHECGKILFNNNTSEDDDLAFLEFNNDGLCGYFINKEEALKNDDFVYLMKELVNILIDGTDDYLQLFKDLTESEKKELDEILKIYK